MRAPARGGGRFGGGGRGGGGRFGGGGRGGGRGFGGGRGRGDFDQGPPAEVIEAGAFAHHCEGEAVCKMSLDNRVGDEEEGCTCS